MDFEKILCAYTVYKNTTITNASKELFMSQSNFSKKISDLENELGFKIFTRNYKAMELTPKGSIFIECCKDMIEQYLSLVDKYDIEQVKGYNIASNYILLIINDLIKSLPQLELEGLNLYFTILDSINIMDKVLIKEIDLGLIITTNNEYEIIKKFCDLNNISCDITGISETCIHVTNKSVFYERESVSKEELKTKQLVKIKDTFGNVVQDLIYLNSNDPNRTILVNDMYEGIIALQNKDMYSLGGTLYLKSFLKYGVKPIPINDSEVKLCAVSIYYPSRGDTEIRVKIGHLDLNLLV